MSPSAVQIINNPHKVPLFESCKEFEIAFTNKAISERILRMSKITSRINTIQLIATNLLQDANVQRCFNVYPVIGVSLHDIQYINHLDHHNSF